MDHLRTRVRFPPPPPFSPDRSLQNTVNSILNSVQSLIEEEIMIQAQSKITFTKDVIQIIRDLLFIFATGVTLLKGSEIVNKQQQVVSIKAEQADEELRTFRINSLRSLAIDIKQIDEELKNQLWVNSLSWQKLKAVRDLKEKEIQKIEEQLK